MIKQDMNVYVSGPMSGIDEYNHPEFNRISKILRDSGNFAKVINPADLDEGEKPWKYYLKRDLKIIIDNDVEALILIPGWHDSKGARAEVYVASEVLGAHLYMYEDLEDGFQLTPYKLKYSMKMTVEAKNTIKLLKEVAV